MQTWVSSVKFILNIVISLFFARTKRSTASFNLHFKATGPGSLLSESCALSLKQLYTPEHRLGMKLNIQGSNNRLLKTGSPCTTPYLYPAANKHTEVLI